METKTKIYIYSYHHGNTKKVADAIAAILEADVVELAKDGSTAVDDMSAYDLVGFGAGIAFSKHYKQLLEFAEKLPNCADKKAFIFSTAGLYSEKKMQKHHTALRNILQSKGFEVVDEFACLGKDTFFILKLFGGINKDRPNAEDLARAEEFAKKMTSGAL